MEKEALEFAAKAHATQQRKYTGEPYIEHPKRVVQILRKVPHSTEMICAAYLHDVVEDTPVEIDEVAQRFGEKVASLVAELTDVYVKENFRHLNRKSRKEREVQRLSSISPEAKTIKLADVIDNTRDIIKNDPGFARRYIPEMEQLTEALQGGNFKLLMLACYEVQRSKLILQSEQMEK